MNKVPAVIAVSIAGFCAGCVLSSAPKGDAGFAPVPGLEALVGCYTNRGEGEGLRYLSAAIWPKEKLAHDQINAIDVALEQPTSLRVSAKASGQTIKESVFVEGKDFKLSSGQIEASDDVMASFAYPSGNVFIGVGRQSTTLGVDKSGNARVQDAGTFAGTAFLIIPVAGHVRDAYRFPKSPGLCK